MILEKIFFNKITPYHRVFIHIETSKDMVFTLPVKNIAVFFLTNNDVVTISDFAKINELPYLDYQLIESDKDFKESMDNFKLYIKNELYKKNFADFIIVQKQIIDNNLFILLRETFINRN